jgi:hypothetical protein
VRDEDGLNGLYQEDRGDLCTVEQITPWSYLVSCVSGRHFSTGAREIQDFIAKGWFTFLKALEPKSQIDETFRANHV